MRLAVFTAREDLEETPHWALLRSVPGIERVLLCVQEPKRGSRAVARSLTRNLKKHGPIYLLYRPMVALAGLFQRPDAPLPLHRPVANPPHVDRLMVPDLHSDDALDAVREWGPDLGLSIGAPILRRKLFGIPRLGTLNIHAGQVPEFRGAPPGFWELYMGAREVGATLHWMTEELDAGEVVDEALAPVYSDDTLRMVQDRAEELAVRVLARGVAAVVNGTATSRPQVGEGRTFRSPTLTTRFRLWLRLSLRRAGRWGLSPKEVVKTTVFGLVVYGVRPLRDLARTAWGTHPVRVFTFHRVTPLVRDGMTVSPRKFRAQLHFLLASHEVLPMESALERLRTREPRRRPIAVVTFDDGYRSVLERAFPLMAREGAPGTCFLSTGLVATDRRFEHDQDSLVRDFMEVMDWDEVRALRGEGWSMGGHTRNHRRVSELGGDGLADEVTGCFRDLSEALGESPPVFAYPFGLPGDISGEAERVVEASGFTAAFQDYGGDVPPDPAWFRLPRAEVGGDHATLAWKARIHGFSLRREPTTAGPGGGTG